MEPEGASSPVMLLLLVIFVISKGVAHRTSADLGPSARSFKLCAVNVRVCQDILYFLSCL